VLSCAVVVSAVALVFVVWTLASQHERRVTYPIQGELSGLELDLGDADLTVIGAGRGGAASVEHVDVYGFGHAAETHREVAGGVFRIRSRCPRTILHDCSVRYRVAVPDNVPLTVRTSTGTVRLQGYRGSARVTTDGGDIDVTGFCGFSLLARAEGTGHVRASTLCPPPRLSLRSNTGSIHVQVPQGRYSVDVSTGGPTPVVRGIEEAPDAPFAIQALSGSGSVLVERRS
jgi:hypothetical protein